MGVRDDRYTHADNKYITFLPFLSLCHPLQIVLTYPSLDIPADSAMFGRL